MGAPLSLEELRQGLLNGNERSLARAATLIESQLDVGRAVVASLFPATGRAMILGITGPPGAGKSTLVSQLTKVFRAQGKTVGILAIDPSSPFSRGAILGDRIRMAEHHADAGVFIRSMASRGKLGGLAETTLDLALLLDAAGRDVVLIETVGVGQDEVEIAKLADITLLVLTPGFGDDVQAIKAGIMEIADIFVINKSDLPGADRLEQEIRAMQSLASDSGRADAAPVRRVIATEGQGVDELAAVIGSVFEKRGHQGVRVETWMVRLEEMLRETLLRSVPENLIEEHARRVATKLEDPYTAVACLMNAR